MGYFIFQRDEQRYINQLFMAVSKCPRKQLLAHGLRDFNPWSLALLLLGQCGLTQNTVLRRLWERKSSQFVVGRKQKKERRRGRDKTYLVFPSGPATQLFLPPIVCSTMRRLNHDVRAFMIQTLNT